MLYNIKPLYLHRVFHGIRFKVNNWRLAVRDGWLFSFIGGNKKSPNRKECLLPIPLLYMLTGTAIYIHWYGSIDSLLLQCKLAATD